MSKKQLENPLINGLDEIMGTSETNLPSEKSAVRHQGTRGPKAGFKRVDVRRKVVSATLPVNIDQWLREKAEVSQKSVSQVIADCVAVCMDDFKKSVLVEFKDTYCKESMNK